MRVSCTRRLCGISLCAWRSISISRSGRTKIHEEWIRNVLEDRPDLTPAQLTRTRELMDRHGGACLVTGYEALIPTLVLPDPDDRHVLAAAIKGQASVIVTFNLKDFPAQALAVHHLRAVHPDDFAVSLYEAEPDLFVQLVKRHRQALVNPKRRSRSILPPSFSAVCTRRLASYSNIGKRYNGHGDKRETGLRRPGARRPCTPAARSSSYNMPIGMGFKIAFRPGLLAK